MDVNHSRENAVREFHKAFGVAIQEKASLELVKLRRDLILEESTELILALDNVISMLELGYEIDKEWIEVLDGMGDLQVVLSGTAVSLEPLKNFALAFVRICESNMTKLGVDGPIYRKDGKILKGPNYKPPVLADLIPE